MKRGLAFIVVTGLILGFQNCSQNNFQSMAGGQDLLLSTPGSSGGQGSDNMAKVTFVEVPNMAQDSSSSQKLSTDELTPYRLVISLQSGAINLMDNTNQVLEKRCLSASSLNELKTIISGASICAGSVQAADMCSQVYTPGYASLYADEQRINLGEKRDSCGAGLKDLCGANSELLKNYVSYVRQHWGEMSCQ